MNLAHSVPFHDATFFRFTSLKSATVNPSPNLVVISEIVFLFWGRKLVFARSLRSDMISVTTSGVAEAKGSPVSVSVSVSVSVLESARLDTAFSGARHCLFRCSALPFPVLPRVGMQGIIEAASFACGF